MLKFFHLDERERESFPKPIFRSPKLSNFPGGREIFTIFKKPHLGFFTNVAVLWGFPMLISLQNLLLRLSVDGLGLR